MTQTPLEPCPLTAEDIERLELDRQSYDKMRAEQCLALDKSIITISGASFGIAIAFIDKIIDKNLAFALWIFWLAMTFLVISIIATTLSFSFSEKALGFARQCIDDCENKGDMNEKTKPNQHTAWLLRANAVRMWTFILGMAFLGIFILSNGMYQSYYNPSATATATVSKEEAMSDPKGASNQQGQRPAGPGSGRFGLEPAAPRPQATNPQPQTQPSPPPAQPASSSDKK